MIQAGDGSSRSASPLRHQLHHDTEGAKERIADKQAKRKASDRARHARFAAVDASLPSAMRPASQKSRRKYTEGSDLSGSQLGGAAYVDNSEAEQEDSFDDGSSNALSTESLQPSQSEISLQPDYTEAPVLPIYNVPQDDRRKRERPTIQIPSTTPQTSPNRSQDSLHVQSYSASRGVEEAQARKSSQAPDRPPMTALRPPFLGVTSSRDRRSVSTPDGVASIEMFPADRRRSPNHKWSHRPFLNNSSSEGTADHTDSEDEQNASRSHSMLPAASLTTPPLTRFGKKERRRALSEAQIIGARYDDLPHGRDHAARKRVQSSLQSAASIRADTPLSDHPTDLTGSGSGGATSEKHASKASRHHNDRKLKERHPTHRAISKSATVGSLFSAIQPVATNGMPTIITAQPKPGEPSLAELMAQIKLDPLKTHGLDHGKGPKRVSVAVPYFQLPIAPLGSISAKNETPARTLSDPDSVSVSRGSLHSDSAAGQPLLPASVHGMDKDRDKINPEKLPKEVSPTRRRRFSMTTKFSNLNDPSSPRHKAKFPSISMHRVGSFIVHEEVPLSAGIYGDANLDKMNEFEGLLAETRKQMLERRSSDRLRYCTDAFRSRFLDTPDLLKSGHSHTSITQVLKWRENNTSVLQPILSRFDPARLAAVHKGLNGIDCDASFVLQLFPSEDSPAVESALALLRQLDEKGTSQKGMGSTLSNWSYSIEDLRAYLTCDGRVLEPVKYLDKAVSREEISVRTSTPVDQATLPPSQSKNDVSSSASTTNDVYNFEASPASSLSALTGSRETAATSFPQSAAFQHYEEPESFLQSPVRSTRSLNIFASAGDLSRKSTLSKSHRRKESRQSTAGGVPQTPVSRLATALSPDSLFRGNFERLGFSSRGSLQKSADRFPNRTLDEMADTMNGSIHQSPSNIKAAKNGITLAQPSMESLRLRRDRQVKDDALLLQRAQEAWKAICAEYDDIGMIDAKTQRQIEAAAKDLRRAKMINTENPQDFSFRPDLMTRDDEALFGEIDVHGLQDLTGEALDQDSGFDSRTLTGIRGYLDAFSEHVFDTRHQLAAFATQLDLSLPRLAYSIASRLPDLMRYADDTRGSTKPSEVATDVSTEHGGSRVEHSDDGKQSDLSSEADDELKQSNQVRRRRRQTYGSTCTSLDNQISPSLCFRAKDKRRKTMSVPGDKNQQRDSPSVETLEDEILALKAAIVKRNSELSRTETFLGGLAAEIAATEAKLIQEFDNERQFRSNVINPIESSLTELVAKVRIGQNTFEWFIVISLVIEMVLRTGFGIVKYIAGLWYAVKSVFRMSAASVR